MTEAQRLKRNEYMRNWMRNHALMDTVCASCSTPFQTRNPRVRYCTQGCAFKNRASLTCETCQRPYVVKGYRRDTSRFCSISCHSKAKVGLNAANWQGGKTDEATLIRTSLSYKEWRLAIFQRDGFACVRCGDATGGNLQADHIKPFALYPELRLELDNGRTLCMSCHKATGTYGSRTRKLQRAL